MASTNRKSLPVSTKSVLYSFVVQGLAYAKPKRYHVVHLLLSICWQEELAILNRW